MHPQACEGVDRQGFTGADEYQYIGIGGDSFDQIYRLDLRTRIPKNVSECAQTIWPGVKRRGTINGWIQDKDYQGGGVIPALKQESPL